ncbi:hypothetical protein AAMO2058_000024100 [Amorphochlora amoebiformis]
MASEALRSIRERGNKRFREKNLNSAVKEYSQGIEIGASNETEEEEIYLMYINRALCWTKLGHLKQAEEDCDKALRLNPFGIKAYRRRALLREKRKDYINSASDLAMAYTCLSAHVPKAKPSILSTLQKSIRQLRIKSKNQNKSDLLVAEPSNSPVPSPTLVSPPTPGHEGKDIKLVNKDTKSEFPEPKPSNSPVSSVTRVPLPKLGDPGEIRGLDTKDTKSEFPEPKPSDSPVSSVTRVPLPRLGDPGEETKDTKSEFPEPKPSNSPVSSVTRVPLPRLGDPGEIRGLETKDTKSEFPEPKPSNSVFDVASMGDRSMPISESIQLKPEANLTSSLKDKVLKHAKYATRMYNNGSYNKAISNLTLALSLLDSSSKSGQPIREPQLRVSVLCARALCFLTMCRFEEAECDCSDALNIHASNIIGLRRRGKARRALGKCLQAAEDFDLALECCELYDTESTVIKQLEELKREALSEGKACEILGSQRAISIPIRYNLPKPSEPRTRAPSEPRTRAPSESRTRAPSESRTRAPSKPKTAGNPMPSGPQTQASEPRIGTSEPGIAVMDTSSESRIDASEPRMKASEPRIEASELGRRASEPRIGGKGLLFRNAAEFSASIEGQNDKDVFEVLSRLPQRLIGKIFKPSGALEPEVLGKIVLSLSSGVSTDPSTCIKVRGQIRTRLFSVSCLIVGVIG